MTNEQKERIAILRNQGYGYIKISQALGLSNNTVRSYCRRNGLDTVSLTNTTSCKQCEKPIKKLTGRKLKIFCSDSCRTKWWNNNLDCVDRKAFYQIICAHCGKAFLAYGNKSRKYCSHACYVSDRFGKERVCNE